MNVFTAWQNTRMNKKAQLETSGGNGLESTNVEDLSVPLEHMFQVQVFYCFTLFLEKLITILYKECRNQRSNDNQLEKKNNNI